ncbi:hypothetical protein PoB_002573300 [Plakobranchus ocellatus]|uniref:Uncharacterized protein n=1 Tax=Plakobranchus ocellatus TaxID=259542 RepID=A0AAV3ZWJ9_9GAST|nr:hypothetical protein PoB_002573300 [Plakobranchus ocellatus]
MEVSDEAEFLGIVIYLPDRKLTIYNCYVSPDKEFRLLSVKVPQEECIIVGDFKSPLRTGANDELDIRGEEVDEQQVNNNLQLQIDKDDEAKFHSRAWKTTSTPDLAFTINNIFRETNR